MIGRRVVFILASAAALSACAVAHHRAPDLTLPAAYEAPAGSQKLSSHQLDDWWLFFSDPELNRLEQQAFTFSPDAKTAAARLLEARSTMQAATSATLPTGSITGNVSRQSEMNLLSSSDQLLPIGGVTETQQLNFNVSWELDFFGRLRTERRIAKADFAASRFDIAAAWASLAANVATDYFQAKGLAIQLDDAQTNADISAHLYDIAKRKADLGLGAATDADRAAGDLALAKAQAVDLGAQLHAAKRQLLILVGRGIEPVTSVSATAEVPDPPPVPVAIPGALLTRRPDIEEARAKLSAEVGQQVLKHLAVFPTFTLLPGLGLTRQVAPGVGFIPPATIFAQQQTTALGFWSLAVGVNQPVLNIPQLLQEAKAEDARTEEAVIAYEKTVQTAYGEAEDDLDGMSSDRKRLAILEDGEARAHRAYDAAETLYREGFDDLTTALSAEENWRNTRSALTSARVAALQRAVQTYKALGGGWGFAAAGTRPSS